MELTKLQIRPLSGVSDWPMWKRRIRDFLAYHEGALGVIDSTLVKPEPLPAESTEEQRKLFKEKSDVGLVMDILSRGSEFHARGSET